MIFQQIKSEGLSQYSYLVGSVGEAAVIDPRRDCQVYTFLARQYGLKIRHVFETHRNEDYVIGSKELNYLTGAKIYHGPRPDWKYGSILQDGQEFQIGTVKLTAMHTPGHTEESMSYVLTDLYSGEAPVMVFSGDTLFVGDAGRVDLNGEEAVPGMASQLYDSIFNKLLPLGDGVILWPAHGAGSLCGANISDRDESTLGIERLQNPVLQFKSKDEFVKFKVAEKPHKPPYFDHMAELNRDGPPLMHHLPIPAPFAAKRFAQELKREALVIDTRQPVAFGGAHIKGSYNIWLAGLPAFAGWVLPYDRPLLLVLENERQDLQIAARDLIRMGYDQVNGYLGGGFEEWYTSGQPVESLPMLSVHELKDKIDSGEDLLVLDVRSLAEWDSGHIKDAMHIYVGNLEERLAEIPEDRPVVVFCSVGNRASLGASILLRAGYPSVYLVLGSMRAWTAAGYPVV